MNNIAFALKNDEKKLKTLWKSAFNDPERYIESYYNNRDNLSKTLVLRLDDKIVSMLEIMEIYLKINGVLKKGIYIYACATDKKYQNRGYMHLLLTHAYNFAKTNHYQFLLLVPQSKKLIEFYKKQGFNISLFNDVKKYVKDDSKRERCNIKPCSEEVFVNLKSDFENSFNCSVIHTKEMLKMIYKQTIASNGQVLLLDNQIYAICYNKKNFLFIQEVNSCGKNLDLYLNECLTFLKNDIVLYNTKGAKNVYALLKPIYDNFNINEKDVYINTMLE